jgi:hypothetical protein
MKKFILYLIMCLLCLSVSAKDLTYKILIGKTWHGEYTLHNDKEATEAKVIADIIFITGHKVIWKEEYKIYDNSGKETGGGASNEIYGYKILESDKSILVICIDYTDNCSSFKFKNGKLVNEDFDNIVFVLKEEK